MSILAKLANLNNLTPNEEELAVYLKKHYKEVLSMTPKDLAEASYVSVASIYRLLNKLELNGFNDLKIELASLDKGDNLTVNINPDYPFLETSDTLETLGRMNSLYQQTMEETTHLFNEESFERSVELLLAAENIDVYTASANLHFAQNFKFQLQELGKLINVPEEDYVQRLSAANSTKKHVAIVVSYGGRGQTTKEVVKILSENQTPIILITSTQNNPLSKYAAEKLFLSSTENHYNKISSFSTRLSLLMIFDLLYTGVFNKNPKGNQQYKLENYQKMNQELI